jgi:hypothetical protein
MTFPNLPDHERANAANALRIAAALFPGEEWIPHGERVYVAKSRLRGGHKEQTRLYHEISDAKILTAIGSVAYFLPEHPNVGTASAVGAVSDGIHSMYADTVIDGAVVELKAVSGNRTTLGKSFRRGYNQGRSLLELHAVRAEHSVFLRLFTPFAVESVRAKIAGELKGAAGPGTFALEGCCICYFEASGQLYSWPYAELRALVGA